MTKIADVYPSAKIDTRPNTSRDDDWKRVSAMAGLDEDGSILPPPPGTKINREPNPWWKTRK